MKVEKKLDIFELISSKTYFELIKKILNSNKPIQFKEFKLLINPKTSKKYSTTTISSKLKDLEKLGIVETKFIENSKRKRFGYSMTKKGIDAICIFKEAEKQYQKLKD